MGSGVQPSGAAELQGDRFRLVFSASGKDGSHGKGGVEGEIRRFAVAAWSPFPP